MVQDLWWTSLHSASQARPYRCIHRFARKSLIQANRTRELSRNSTAH